MEESHCLYAMEDDMLYSWATFTPPLPELLVDELVQALAPPLPVLPPPPAVGEGATGAFEPYCGRTQGVPPCGGSGKSLHKRVIEFLRLIPMPHVAGGSKGNVTAGRRCFRHMMKERQRRERQSQGYADLYSLVSPKSKADKNSILQSSVVYLKELKATESRLRRRNQELQAQVASKGATTSTTDGPNCIKLRLGNPISSIDSMFSCLQRIKQMGVRTKSIHSTLVAGELSVAVEIETEVFVHDV